MVPGGETKVEGVTPREREVTRLDTAIEGW